MPHWTNEQLRSTKAGNAEQNQFAYRRTQAATQLQKQQNADAGPLDNRPQKTGMDEGVPGRYGVAISFVLPPGRARDGDGCEATILDCLMHARRRLLAFPDPVLLAVLRRAQGVLDATDPD